MVWNSKEWRSEVVEWDAGQSEGQGPLDPFFFPRAVVWIVYPWGPYIEALSPSVVVIRDGVFEGESG